MCVRERERERELLLLLLLLLLALVPIIVLLSHSCVLFFVTNTFSLTVAVKMWYVPYSRRSQKKTQH